MIIKITVQFNKDYPNTDNCHSFHFIEVDEDKFDEIFVRNMFYKWEELTKTNYELAKYIMHQDATVCRYVEFIQYVLFTVVIPYKFEF